jgi:hypothetical protein
VTSNEKTDEDSVVVDDVDDDVVVDDVDVDVGSAILLMLL